jgi:hypothetical protein
MTTFTPEQLKTFFSGNYFHKTYNATKEIADGLRLHADGIYPKALIEERRPSEGLAVKAYRQKIWKPITKSTVGRVILAFQKIRKSADWSIKFDSTKLPSSIIEQESPANYLEKNFPKHNSLTNWAFSILLKSWLIDSNGCIAVFPEPFKNNIPNSYQNPIPYIFDADCIIDYKEGEYYVLKSTDKVIYGTDKKSWGDVYYILDKNSVFRFEQIDSIRSFKLAWEYVHNLNEVQVIPMKGVFKKNQDNQTIYESVLQNMVPFLDEAVREYSDVQAEVVKNIHSKEWEFVTDDCQKCKGKGTYTATGLTNTSVTCELCNGSGGKTRGPYSTLQIKAPMAGEISVPTPPMGYVQKDTSIIEIQDKRVEKHKLDALASVNMQFLEQIPLNQSGVAKEVDQDGLNTTVNFVAENIVYMMDRFAYLSIEQRYNTVVSDKQTRMDLLPTIAVPDKLDLLSASYLETQLKNAKDAKANPVIIVAMEKEYANKKFANDPQVRDMVSLILSLDPLAGVSEDDKLSRLGNKGITMETYVMSCNLQEFINRAIDEKGDAFYTLKTKDQKIIIREFAKQQIEEENTTSKIIDLANAENDPLTKQ